MAEALNVVGTLIEAVIMLAMCIAVEDILKHIQVPQDSIKMDSMFRTGVGSSKTAAKSQLKSIIIPFYLTGQLR